jgi:AAA family ATP:ADP antiporter
MTKGVVTMIMMFISSYVLPKVPWVFPAMTTPIVMFILNLFFFTWLHFLTGYSYIIAVIGAIVVIFSKASKYSLFDPCKEIVYIPLTDTERKLGKSTVDVISNPLGKSGGSMLQQVMIMVNGSIIQSTNQLFTVMMCGLFMWILAVANINKHLKERSIKT